jgi:hypothetical protein
VTEAPMIISMSTMARSQQRYDHRLRNLVQLTGEVTVATDLGVPRSTARGWLGKRPTVVVCVDVTELTEPELRQEVHKLRRRVQKLTALLRRSNSNGTSPVRRQAFFPVALTHQNCYSQVGGCLIQDATGVNTGRKGENEETNWIDYTTRTNSSH